jgi:hypothetical protein
MMGIKVKNQQLRRETCSLSRRSILKDETGLARSTREAGADESKPRKEQWTMIVYVIMCLVCGGATAAIADSKGRHAGGWFALGAVFGLFALIAVIAMPAIGRKEA